VTRKVALVLAAALTVALVLSLGSVAESSSGGPQAVAAKKCKKKGKKSAVAAKKKKCKKKKVATIPSGPTLRATLTWNTTADLDLYVWDVNGTGGFGAVGIPSSQFLVDTDGFGPETFTDLLSPSSRNFTIGFCAAAVGSPTNLTLTVKSQSGSTSVFTEDDFLGPLIHDGEWGRLVFSNGDEDGFDPGGGSGVNGWCRAPD
jgi:hypothetical protein